MLCDVICEKPKPLSLKKNEAWFYPRSGVSPMVRITSGKLLSQEAVLLVFNVQEEIRRSAVAA